MTMQTTTLPFQVSGAGAPAQPQRSPSAGVQAPEGVDFSATLSRAMAPTAAPMPAPAAAPASRQAAPAKPADKPAAAGPKTPAREPARQNEAASDAPATAQQAASTGEAADAGQDATAAEAASAAAEAATTPVTDMLAFMASLAQPAPAAAAVAAVAAAPAAGPAGAGADLQLSALQSAFAKLETTDGAAAADPALPAVDGDATGFSLAAGVQPAAQDATDLRTLQQGAQATVQADGGKAQPQARDAAGAAAAEAPVPSVTQLQAQAAKLEAAPAPAAVPGDRIPARVGTQAWDNQVSQRIVYMVGKEQAATLTLNPPDLGPVQVVLSVSNDGASVAFSSNQQEVRQALENALPRLREMMSENGIALGNATVDAGVSDQRQAQQDGERRNHGASGLGNAAGDAAANEDNTARPATRTVVLGDNGLVDTFA